MNVSCSALSIKSEVRRGARRMESREAEENRRRASSLSQRLFLLNSSLLSVSSPPNCSLLTLRRHERDSARRHKREHAELFEGHGASSSLSKGEKKRKRDLRNRESRGRDDDERVSFGSPFFLSSFPLSSLLFPSFYKSLPPPDDDAAAASSAARALNSARTSRTNQAKSSGLELSASHSLRREARHSEGSQRRTE